jgi:hypothetical protein
LFGGFAGIMPVFDSSPAYMSGLCFSLPGPILAGWLSDAGEVSRFSHMQFLGALLAL